MSGIERDIGGDREEEMPQKAIELTWSNVIRHFCLFRPPD